MEEKQIVILGTNHVCPMVTGATPHVGGPVVGPGCPGVLINGQPVALMGDTCVCNGAPDTIVQGYPGILVNGVPIAVQGCMTAHGGILPTGVPGVTVGSATPVEPLTMDIKRIEIPKIRVIDTVGAAVTGQSKSLKEAKRNIDELKKQEYRQEPMVYNLRWEKDGIRINTGRIDEYTKIMADTSGIADGETVKVKVCTDEKKNTVEEIESVVKEGKIEIGWDILEFK